MESMEFLSILRKEIEIMKKSENHESLFDLVLSNPIIAGIILILTALCVFGVIK